MEWRFSHWVPPSHPMHPAAEAWAASIEKASGGTIKMKIFPAQQLGKAFDHYNMARDGIADVAHVNPGYEPGRFPVMGAMELPFLFANSKEGSAALDAWYRKYAGQGDGGRQILPHLRARSRHVPFDQEEDRGAGRREGHEGAARQRHDRALHHDRSAAPTCRPPRRKSRDVLEKGVAEAITFPWGSIVLFGIDKVTKYHLDAAFYVTEQGWVINKGKYEALSAGAEKGDRRSLHAGMVREDRRRHGPTSRPAAATRSRRRRARSSTALTPAQLAEWRKAAEPLYAEWAENAKKAGYDPAAIMKDLKDSLAKYNSSY